MYWYMNLGGFVIKIQTNRSPLLTEHFDTFTLLTKNQELLHNQKRRDMYSAFILKVSINLPLSI